MKDFMLGFIVGAMVAMLLVGYVNNLPEDKPTETAAQEVICTFDDMLDAIEWVESKGDAEAIGDNGKAVGSFQIWKIYVDDCNRILKINGESKRVTYVDRYDPEESRKITAYVTSHYANATWKDKPHTQMQFIETAARSHHRPADRNNSKTDAYWAKVKKEMEK